MLKFLTATLLFAASIPVICTAQIVERVEPPFWWRGMNNDKLQILIYGDEVGNCGVRFESEIASLEQSVRTSNPNYLFLDVRIVPGTSAGEMQIELTRGDESVDFIRYILNERDPGSANRKGFDNSDVMYLITPDRFANGDPENDAVEGMREQPNRSDESGRHGGDLKGIRDHLDYIKDMGFTAIWLNPVLENDMEKYSYHGYATTDYYKVDPRYGTNEQYRDLCKEAADMGIGMIMDVIVNHCGLLHWWMEDPPTADWINGQGEPYQQTNHRKTTLLDPHVAPSDREKMVEGWFVPTMPDLNQNNPLMSTYLIQNSIWWIEYAGLAGLRQDTYSYPFRDFMTDWTCAIMHEYPNFNIVGEEWVDNPVIVSYWQQGKDNPDGYTSCLPSLMDFPMTMTMHKALVEEETFGKGFIRLYEMLAYDFLYADPDALVIFPDNHDMSRIFKMVDYDWELLKMAVAYTLTMRGTPQIYYGTEILMANMNSDSHGEIRADFPGGWKGDTINAFTGEGLSRTSLETQEFMRTLLKWRKEKDVIHHGELTHYAPSDSTYVYFRHDDNDAVMVVLNKNEEPYPLMTARFEEQLDGFGRARNVLTGEVVVVDKVISLPQQGPYVFELLD